MANNILEMALERLEQENILLPSTISAWFDDATVVSFSDNRLVIHSPNDFKKDTIEKRVIGNLETAL